MRYPNDKAIPAEQDNIVTIYTPTRQYQLCMI